MIKKIKYFAFSFSLIFSIACEKNEFIGPPIESFYGNLEILESFSNDKPVGVDFSIGDTVNFNCEFSISSNYQINIVGRTSGATFSILGSNNDLSDSYWLGNSQNIFFKQYEWCDITLSFGSYDTTLTDSVLILGVRDFSNDGLLLTSFENSNEYSIVTSSNNDEFGVNSNPNFAIHGTNYLNTLGIGNSSWFGAVRFSWNSSPITHPDINTIFFNGFFYSDFPGSAFVIKVFEDQNGNGVYDAGIDEAYASKINLNTNSQWNKYHISLAELIIDQSGNNVLIDGELNPQNIIRVDITNSQSGTVNGQFGYSADYFIITYNEPL